MDSGCLLKGVPSGAPFSMSKQGGTAMNEQLTHDYYYGCEAEQYTFYRFPKALFTNDRYKGLSDGAKILYGLMLDRMGLSLKNGWLDDANRVFIFFTLEDLQEYMSCGHNKGVKLMAELDNIGLIERVKQGLGRPAIICQTLFDRYRLSHTAAAERQLSTGLCTRKSRLSQTGSADFPKANANKTEFNNPEFNKNDFSKTYPIQSYQWYGEPADHSSPHGLDADGMGEVNSYRELIEENIEYDCLIGQYGKERMDELVELMLDTVCSRRDYITISGDDYPKEVVKSRLLKLTSEHIGYVFDRIDQNTTKVRNVRKYLLAALYNSPTSMDTFYRVEVNHDLYGS
jgi:hypothetical protein